MYTESWMQPRRMSRIPCKECKSWKRWFSPWPPIVTFTTSCFSRKRSWTYILLGGLCLLICGIVAVTAPFFMNCITRKSWPTWYSIALDSMNIWTVCRVSSWRRVPLATRPLSEKRITPSRKRSRIRTRWTIWWWRVPMLLEKQLFWKWPWSMYCCLNNLGVDFINRRPYVPMIPLRVTWTYRIRVAVIVCFRQRQDGVRKS